MEEERLFIDGGKVCGGAGKVFKVGERNDGGACGGLADANRSGATREGSHSRRAVIYAGDAVQSFPHSSIA